ncbi:hypothetical protein L1281_000334 [Neisseria sp. HSC-16F19]|nr:hypothetical protein [Neisseria sp. HSC-16F19]MCP2039764.1 hypothetical protein [Neisseria sp. HSC-16F19]
MEVFTLPPRYQAFLSRLDDDDCADIRNSEGAGAYFYGKNLLPERNETYAIAEDAPGCLLIGQDGDLGLFILPGSDDTVYALDLGALGTAPMQALAADIDAWLAQLGVQF